MIELLLIVLMIGMIYPILSRPVTVVEVVMVISICAVVGGVIGL